MTTMNISLPDEMRHWIVSDRLAIGQYHNASEYIRDLIRRDQQRVARIQAFDEAIALGRAAPADPRSPADIIAAIKRAPGLE